MNAKALRLSVLLILGGAIVCFVGLSGLRTAAQMRDERQAPASELRWKAFAVAAMGLVALRFGAAVLAEVLSHR